MKTQIKTIGIGVVLLVFCACASVEDQSAEEMTSPSESVAQVDQALFTGGKWVGYANNDQPTVYTSEDLVNLPGQPNAFGVTEVCRGVAPDSKRHSGAVVDGVCQLAYSGTVYKKKSYDVLVDDGTYSWKTTTGAVFGNSVVVDKTVAAGKMVEVCEVQIDYQWRPGSFTGTNCELVYLGKALKREPTSYGTVRLLVHN